MTESRSSSLIIKKRCPSAVTSKFEKLSPAHHTNYSCPPSTAVPESWLKDGILLFGDEARHHLALHPVNARRKTGSVRQHPVIDSYQPPTAGGLRMRPLSWDARCDVQHGLRAALPADRRDSPGVQRRRRAPSDLVARWKGVGVCAGTRPTGGDQSDNATGFRDDSTNKVACCGIMGPPSIVRNHDIMPDGARFLGLTGGDDEQSQSTGVSCAWFSTGPKS
jgi:hypothetical protein